MVTLPAACTANQDIDEHLRSSAFICGSKAFLPA